ncbi:hypothetical protein G6F46_006424 [Rhizopus delemar]|uniref:F-box domain-containing protein n=3 Tax=Rhizopus TaxID=4842 RepID=I1CMU5_RHIO9|nr:hypothetical protein RO3G_14486 [Rhizopus delemar RA 99-880]KAG1050702.1 hypothetical protein G6F43_007044 [Rhizopus delemar]KAG1544734.1 hypothetical protein G6F51_005884 [Rhizopus arrhizus]KAG1458014.1 hypothetical protein G6F55_005592 [Rhizopus delemar]KAG1497427.1 hypothetical protein G6F54_005773 [Rhizopus delemar]|eukprot:EIE89775.1 hypothetical protein RO3G_14486 [Rhizopus delemar RA 99-880]
MDSVLPAEIILNIFNHLSLKDLVRIERSCKRLQSCALSEIEKRIRKGSTKDEWGILVHLGQVNAEPQRFDTVTKKAYYSIQMDPVKIKSMFEKRQIHCSLLRKNSEDYDTKNKFTIHVQKGMEAGKRIEIDVKNESCQVQAQLTRLPHPTRSLIQHDPKQPLIPLAPSPFIYTLQLTELCLPLSTLAA